MASEVLLKTAVNTRSSLESRLPKKPREPQAPGSYALHHALETTYDIDYTAMPLDKVVDKSNRFSVSRTSGPTFTNVSGDNDRHLGMAEGMTRLHHAAAQRHRQSAASGMESEGGVRDRVVTVGDVEEDRDAGAADKSQKAVGASAYRIISYPSSAWESEAHAATRHVEPEQRLDFYSTVRKVERLDDDQRGGLAGSVRRGVEIRTKRGCDPVMKPPERAFQQAEPVEMPLVAAQEKRLVRRNYLDLVECSHLDPDSEHHFGFHDAPVTRLPGADLSQHLDVQSKAITHMGTSEDMFRGYPKYLDDKTIGYAGHVPQHDRNLSAIHHGEDVRRLYSKSIMTLAVHGGGVDSAVTSGNLRARHRAGKSAPAPKILKPKSDALIRETMEGRMLQAPLYQTLARERAMNIRDDNQGTQYF